MTQSCSESFDLSYEPQVQIFNLHICLVKSKKTQRGTIVSRSFGSKIVYQIRRTIFISSLCSKTRFSATHGITGIARYGRKLLKEVEISLKSRHFT